MILSSVKVLRASVFVFLAFVFLSSCQQNAVQPSPPSTTSQDTVPPVLTLSCGDTVYHTFNTPFTAPPATAIDAIDGNISANIVVTNNVNTAVPGTYWVHYFIMDSDSNTAADTVTVIVQNNGNSVGGAYNGCWDSCQVTGTFNYYATVTVSTTVSGLITINNFGAFGTSINVDANISGTSISVPPSQNLGNPGSLMNGSGVIVNPTTGDFDITFTWTDGANWETCYSHYRR